METREEQWRRVSAMAGVDEDGGILPPDTNSEIDTSANPYWRNGCFDADAYLWAEGTPGAEGLSSCLPDTLMVSPEHYALYQLAHDRFGIYAQRKALAKAGLATHVYRGEEWWH